MSDPARILDSSLLAEALQAHPNAVRYLIGRALAQTAGARAMTQVDDGELNVWAFAEDGGCTVELAEQIHHDSGLRWATRGQVYPGFTTFVARVRWEALDFEVVQTSWMNGYERERAAWVFGASAEQVARFVTAALDASYVPRRRILVYDGSCWNKDRGLFEAIQRASWDDLVLEGDLLDRLRDDVLSFVAAKDLYARYGVPYKRGVLLTGPPGNGKTHCVRVLMKETSLPVLYVRSFEAKYGEVDHNIMEVFDRARRAAPCLLVLEDLETLVKQENLSAFLNELDGVRSDTGILSLATSNHPERLDPALVERPSRFDRKYHFLLPAAVERGRFLAQWNARLDLELRVDDDVVTRLAHGSEGFSFAYLKELCVSGLTRWVATRESGAMARMLEEELVQLRRQMKAAAPPEANEPAAT